MSVSCFLCSCAEGSFAHELQVVPQTAEWQGVAKVVQQAADASSHVPGLGVRPPDAHAHGAACGRRGAGAGHPAGARQWAPRT